LVGLSFECSNRTTTKIRSKIKVQVFLKKFQNWKNEEKSQKTLLKCRKWHFLENLSLQAGNDEGLCCFLLRLLNMV